MGATANTYGSTSTPHRLSRAAECSTTKQPIEAQAVRRARCGLRERCRQDFRTAIRGDRSRGAGTMEAGCARRRAVSSATRHSGLLGSCLKRNWVAELLRREGRGGQSPCGDSPLVVLRFPSPSPSAQRGEGMRFCRWGRDGRRVSPRSGEGMLMAVTGRMGLMALSRSRCCCRPAPTCTLAWRRLPG